MVIPGNVKKIGNNAFSWCESLTDLTISAVSYTHLSARVKAVLRRYSGHDTDDSEVIKFDNLEISLQKYELKLAGKPVDIPPKEV